MTSLDELTRTLERGADRAPDAIGLVEQARAGAERLRRRNRLRAVGAVVVAVAVAVTVPVVVRSYAADPPRPNPAGPMTYYREPYELSLELAPSRVYFTMTHGTEGKTQFLIARPIANSQKASGGTIAAYDPGTFDPTRLRQGERVTVQGREAFYVKQLDPPAPSSSGPMGAPYRVGAAVGWQDPSGVWVTVSESADRAEMLRLADAVRLTTPRAARAPVRFGWVPRGLPVSFTESRDIAEYGVSASIGFGGPSEPAGQVSPSFFMPYDTPLTVMALPMKGIMTAWGENYSDGRTRTIGGHPTWYLDGEKDNLTDGGKGSQFMIQAGDCGITVVVRDKTFIPYEDLVRMAGNMSFGGCDDTSDWLPITG
ncbi:hypothetical protein JIG36_28430 [Actinoplanes sp. LDG1-06]|uniref:DUF4367 domain-containing protein n=1 Tax=Paractinoplanes ovalisporus TaxID=2810368 RepID=A0ABS2AI14_9ACTN|nr:hypothetical protein [Actinoplanes ovalisporus]MBM2619487.1 hypothetical protein [Actinoplanes ovalisporus]